MADIFLLTGWGVGTKPLQPLTKYLIGLGHSVMLTDLPYHTNASQWLPIIAEQLPAQSYWLGWSLGGQLLSYLTKDYAEQCQGLITLASNPCYKERTDWPTAMDTATFNSFQRAYQQTPSQTLQRFLQLVAKGSPKARQLVRQLQREVIDLTVTEANAGLELLATLDTRQALQGYQARQLHLLAELDVLVPVAASQALQQLVSGLAQIKILADTGHGFPVQAPLTTAKQIDDFIKVGL